MSLPDELGHLDVAATLHLLRSGEVTVDECVEAAATRIEQRDPQVGAFVWQADPARRLETLDRSAPLAGVPFAIKDWQCTAAGEPSWWGNARLHQMDRRAEEDTELMRRYRRAGLVDLGRTSLPEFAFGPPTTEPVAFGPCRNPWDPSLSVGGSSGGSAAAVAARMVPAANASDGGGSLRIPAACCGLVGLKTTPGRITVAPHAEGRRAKVEGHLTRTVLDCALLLDHSHGPAPGDLGLGAPAGGFVESLHRPLPPLRIGLMVRPPRCLAGDTDPFPGTETEAQRIAQMLASLGHHLDEAHPAELDVNLPMSSLYAAERAVLRHQLERVLGRPLSVDDVEPRSWAMFELAAATDGSKVLALLQREQRWARAVRSWFRAEGDDDGFDLLLTPTLGRSVPAIGEFTPADGEEPLAAAARGLPMAWFTYPFNVSGNPAIALPTGSGSPPESVQLVAAPGREDLLLRVGAQLETAVGGFDRAPRPT